MDAVVVLELDASQLKELSRRAEYAQKMGGFAQRFGFTGSSSQQGKLPGADQLLAVTDGKPTTPLPGGGNLSETEQGLAASSQGGPGFGVGAIAGLAAIAGLKLMQFVINFATNLLKNSQVLNSYFGAMGKVLSAAVDILLMPFIPILNLILATAVRFLAWMVANNIPQKLYNGMVAVWHGLQVVWSWFKAVVDFFNGNPFDPTKWDWNGLGNAIGAALTKLFGWLVAAFKSLGAALSPIITAFVRSTNKKGFQWPTSWGAVGQDLKMPVVGGLELGAQLRGATDWIGSHFPGLPTDRLGAVNAALKNQLPPLAVIEGAGQYLHARRAAQNASKQVQLNLSVHTSDPFVAGSQVINALQQSPTMNYSGPLSTAWNTNAGEIARWQR